MIAQTGAYEHAETAARSITDSDTQTWALTALAKTLMDAQEYDRAETIARSLIDASEQAQALATLAKSLASANHTDRAVVLIDAASRVATTIEPQDRHWVLAAIAEAAIAAGDHARAATTISAAEEARRQVTDPYQ